MKEKEGQNEQDLIKKQLDEEITKELMETAKEDETNNSSN